jgi:hypothetical protein
MTIDEFKSQLARLRESPAQKFQSQTFASTLWHSAKDITQIELKRMVDKVLLGKHDFDFQSEIEFVKRNRANIDNTKKAIESTEVVSDDGLSKVLEQFGASSLVDAIAKASKSITPEQESAVTQSESVFDDADFSVNDDKQAELKAIAEERWKQKFNRGIE